MESEASFSAGGMTQKRKGGKLIKYCNSLVSGKLSLPLFSTRDVVTLSLSTSLFHDVFGVATVT